MQTNSLGCESAEIQLGVDVNPIGILEGSRGGWFRLQPNPFRTATTIQFANPNAATFKVELFDQTGRVVRSIENVRGEQVMIDREDLSSGVYHLRLTGDQIYNAKLVIED